MKTLKRGRLRKRLPKKFWKILWLFFILFLILLWLSVWYIKTNSNKYIQYAEEITIIPTPTPLPIATHIPTPLPLPSDPRDILLDMVENENQFMPGDIYRWQKKYYVDDFIDNSINTDEIEIDNEPEAEWIDLYPEIPLDNETEFYIYDKCMENGLNFKIVLGLIYAESEFNHMCRDNQNTNGTYDVGLFQINSNNFEWMERVFGERWDEYDLYDNIDAGIYILKYALSVTDNEHGMLMVYNMGENGARKKWAEGILTTPYSKKVINFANSLPDVEYEEVNFE